jgi:small conductance mechanosensitive channel
VKSVGIRVTSIQVWTGEVVFIPNGEIKQVTNFSKENSFAVIDIKIGYKTEADRAIGLIKQTMDELKGTEDDIVGDASVLGVQELNDSTYTVRAIAECKPYTHWAVQRLAKQRIRALFSEHNIDLPMSKIVYLSENATGHFHPKPES